MPTRYLKPGVRDSEAIDSLSPLAETLFYRLLVTVDDFGRYDGRPAMVKAHCFPIKDLAVAKCAALLQELHEAGLVVLYAVDGKPYLQMCKWENVPRSKESKYPAPGDDCLQMHADVHGACTVLPVTVTVTGTDNREPKPETGNREPDAPRKRSADPDPQMPPPADLDLQAWGRWVDYRRKIAKPLKPASIPAAQIALAKHGPDQAAVVEQSIANGWQGLFALKTATQRVAPSMDKAARDAEAMRMLGFGDVIDAEAT